MAQFMEWLKSHLDQETFSTCRWKDKDNQIFEVLWPKADKKSCGTPDNAKDRLGIMYAWWVHKFGNSRLEDQATSIKGNFRSCINSKITNRDMDRLSPTAPRIGGKDEWKVFRFLDRRTDKTPRKRIPEDNGTRPNFLSLIKSLKTETDSSVGLKLDQVFSTSTQQYVNNTENFLPSNEPPVSISFVPREGCIKPTARFGGLPVGCVEPIIRDPFPNLPVGCVEPTLRNNLNNGMEVKPVPNNLVQSPIKKEFRSDFDLIPREKETMPPDLPLQHKLVHDLLTAAFQNASVGSYGNAIVEEDNSCEDREETLTSFLSYIKKEVEQLPTKPIDYQTEAKNKIFSLVQEIKKRSQTHASWKVPELRIQNSALIP